MNDSPTFDTLLNRGIEFITTKQFTEALAVAREIQALDSDSADGFHLAAIALQHAYKWEESLKELEQAILNAPYDAGLYSLRGFAFMSLNQHEKAEADFQEAISLEDFEPAHRNLVLLRIVQNRSEEAIEMLTNRIKKNPGNVENLTMMGDLLTSIGNPEKAEGWYAAAEEASSENN